jgi:hypothetical protein
MFGGHAAVGIFNSSLTIWFPAQARGGSPLPNVNGTAKPLTRGACPHIALQLEARNVCLLGWSGRAAVTALTANLDPRRS